MAVTSVVKLSELEGARRIDAEYYQLEYFHLLKKLKSLETVPAKKIVIPARRKFKPKENEYFNYIEISEVDLSTGEFNISKVIGEEAPDRAQWVVKKGDILISTVRPIRNAVVLIKNEENSLVASSGFCVLQPQKVTPEYLFLYFKIGFMKYLLDRYTTATEYPAITWEDILNVPIYLGNDSFQKNISEIVNSALILLEQSQKFYSQAEYLLLSEVGLQDFKPKDELCYETKLSQASTVHRIDAEYFNPSYDEIIEIINKKFETKPLSRFITSIKKGIEVGTEKYQDEGIPFIRVSNLSVNGLVDRDQKYLHEEDYQLLKDKFEPNEGEILLTKDATPGIAYFIKEPIKCIISSGILRLNVRDIKPEYLCLCINSIIGKSQIERDGGGSVITHWKPYQIKRLQIPILPIQIQNKIAELVQESHEARRKAKQLLEEAKKKVEDAINENNK